MEKLDDDSREKRIQREYTQKICDEKLSLMKDVVAILPDAIRICAFLNYIYSVQEDKFSGFPEKKHLKKSHAIQQCSGSSVMGDYPGFNPRTILGYVSFTNYLFFIFPRKLKSDGVYEFYFNEDNADVLDRKTNLLLSIGRGSMGHILGKTKYATDEDKKNDTVKTRDGGDVCASLINFIRLHSRMVSLVRYYLESSEAMREYFELEKEEAI